MISMNAVQVLGDCFLVHSHKPLELWSVVTVLSVLKVLKFVSLVLQEPGVI